MGAVARKGKGGGGTIIPLQPDPEEEFALDRATEKLKEFFPGHASPRAVVSSIISTWIVERVRLSIGRIMCGDLAYGLGDAHLRGSLEQALPKIAGELGHLPPDKPFFDLSKDQVIDILAIGYHAGKSAGALFDDEIPFG